MTWSPVEKSFGRRCAVLDHTRNEIVASVARSFIRPNTLPPRTFHDVISPSTHTEPHRSTKPRMVSFSRATEVGACIVESRGGTESGGRGCPGTASGWNVVIGSRRWIADRPELGRRTEIGRAHV